MKDPVRATSKEVLDFNGVELVVVYYIYYYLEKKGSECKQGLDSTKRV